VPHRESLPTPYAEAVLDLVDSLPAGSAVSYGAIAARLAGGGPRQVGSALSRFGGGVAWFRVVRADGSPAPVQVEEQLALLRADGVPLLASGRRVDLTAARPAGW
jgi:alkylated DNA nucleotide flippase Atl1